MVTDTFDAQVGARFSPPRAAVPPSRSLAVALFDLPLDQLERYTPAVPEPEDLDAFWADTLAAARVHAPVVAVERVVERACALLDTWDLTFSGFDGQPVRGWYSRPRGTAGGDLPGRRQTSATAGGAGSRTSGCCGPPAGYAHVLVDSRGQGSQYGNGGDTPDPVPEPAVGPGLRDAGNRRPGRRTTTAG